MLSADHCLIKPCKLHLTGVLCSFSCWSVTHYSPVATANRDQASVCCPGEISAGLCTASQDALVLGSQKFLQGPAGSCISCRSSGRKPGFQQRGQINDVGVTLMLVSWLSGNKRILTIKSNPPRQCMIQQCSVQAARIKINLFKVIHFIK